MPSQNLLLADEFAKDYDQSVAKNGWEGPKILFDLLKPYIEPGKTLLDLGIGTGASSQLFYEAGLVITGVDGSQEMLRECEKKAIANNLVFMDLEQPTLPFPSSSFDIVYSNALFHLINPIEHLFTEANRILSNKGIFAFTFEDTMDTKDYHQFSSGVWETKTESGVWAYKHTVNYISNLLINNGFRQVQQKKFLAYKNIEQGKEYNFTAVVSQKK